MPNTSKRRTLKQSVPEVPDTPANVAAAREPRGARRKRETRARLLDAALKLMAEKGMEGVAINDLAEAADVGFGSFYNHFESKEAIYNELVNSLFNDFADTLDGLAGGLSDPAEMIAICVRHTLMRARHEPVWGQFLIREGFSARIPGRGFGERLLRDIERGIAAKRFVVSDPFVSFLSAGGTVLAAVAAEVHFVAPGAPAAGALEEFGFSGAHFAERAAALILQSLGLKRAEAEKIELAARAEIEAAGRAARMELKVLGARLAVERAEVLLKQELAPKSEAALIRTFIVELEGSGN